MRARPPSGDTSLIAAQFEAALGVAEMRALSDSFAAATPEVIAAILLEAGRFADLTLVPLNETADRLGCTIEGERVRTAPGHRDAWAAFVAAGWGTLDQPEAFGGQGLPLALAVMVQEICDRACPAFGMLPVPQRAAARLIAAHGDASMQAEWLQKLVAGVWGATICISEVEAGSDLGRIRSRAVPLGGGRWAVTGEKCWISYGDHDLTARIGHCLLARTPEAPAGSAGLSLFLVPDTLVLANGEEIRNQVVLRRIEPKMGLHGSPTCALGFEAATGWIIGEEGRGLAQLFVMITTMRLSVGVQGLGIAAGGADLALAYAEQRRQGGPVGAAVAIADHADIQRELLGMVARVEVLRGLILAVANHVDISAQAADPKRRADAAALVQFLLPIVKTTGGEFAMQVADAAIQVLGGAGYTRDWPVEQALRDARVLTIFEGTTGIQALDLLHRRLLRGDRIGLSVFRALADKALAACTAPEAVRFARCLERFDEAVDHLLSSRSSGLDREAAATAFLHLAAITATGWIAAHLASLTDPTASARKLVAAGRTWLSDIDERAALLTAQVLAGGDAVARFDDIRVKG